MDIHEKYFTPAKALEGDSGLNKELSELSATAGDFPVLGIMPKAEIGALEFLEKYPTYDGRGTIVAIFDQGCDPLAGGMQVTTDGKPKYIDFVDGSGSGDVDCSTVVEAKDQTITGLSGRTLKLGKWSNPTGKYHIGIKRAYELYGETLVKRLKRSEKERFGAWQRNKAMTLQNNADNCEGTDKDKKKELKAQHAQFSKCCDSRDDSGPVFDCVVFHDGENWRAVVDKHQDGDLTQHEPMANYRLERQISVFDSDSLMPYSVNVYNDGNVLSIVTSSGNHGTHVAGIVGANFPGQPERNGVAPGCQFICVKVGDNRVGTMETGQAMIRGLIAARECNVDLINMSYGEPTTVCDGGRFDELSNELVRDGVIFVSSAGNSGPALSTVGAPGGTASNIIGVGAYVSKTMMDAAYPVLEATPENNYTWSSRGPTYDGDTGVCISAPGGAIASVCLNSLKQNQLMNGTSMSSPCACGGIALLLSGLKAQNIAYSPFRVRRALENTARLLPNVERFAQGSGVLQVCSAFNHLTKFAPLSDQDINFKVSIGSRNNARGLYLRDARETKHPCEYRVSVNAHFKQPIFKGDEADDAIIADHTEELKLNIRLALVCTAPWVQATKHVLLMNGGRGFNVRVDPTMLTPGAHFAEVLAFDTENRDRGHLFRVPVTVLKTEETQEDESVYTYNDMTFSAGKIVRRFIQVPYGATWADFILKGKKIDTQRQFNLHCCYLSPETAFRETEQACYKTLKEGSVHHTSMKVEPGRTLEVCLSQTWAEMGTATVDMEVTFHSVLPKQQEIVFQPSQSIVRVDVSSTLRKEFIEPRIDLKKLLQSVAPSDNSITLLNADRDLLPNHKLVSQLILTYNWESKEKAKLTCRAPILNGRLYESAYGAQLWTLFDSNKKSVGTGDAWPESIQVLKGKYTLRLAVRHDDVSLLEKLKSLVVTFETVLSSSIRLGAYSAYNGALTGGKKFGTKIILKGDTVPVFFTHPSTKAMYKHASPGDILTGTAFYSKKMDYETGGMQPTGWKVSLIVPPKPSNKKTSGGDTKAKNGKSNSTPNEEEKKIESLPDPFYWDKNGLDALVKELTTQNNTKERKNNEASALTAVVTAADAVIGAIDRDAVLVASATFAGTGDEAAGKEKKGKSEQKKSLIDALNKKACALKDLIVAEEKHDGEENKENASPHLPTFQTTLKELSILVDMTKDVNKHKYVWLLSFEDQLAGNFGLVLEHLNSALKYKSDSVPEANEKKLIETRADILGKLGWGKLVEGEKKRLLVEFPKAFTIM